MCPTAQPQDVLLNIGFTRTNGAWNMPALALGQGGLQSDPMIRPHLKEIRELRPRTIRIFLSEYYRIYPQHGVDDFSKLDLELQAVRATGSRPALALAMKPPVLFPVVDHFAVHPNNYDEWETLCEMLARHCLEKKYGIAAWEVCNEPDIGETGGTPQFFNKAEDYSTFYDHTIAGLRRGDPTAFVIETMRRFDEAGLDLAAYYHIRDCFVDPADFDWMSPGGVRFMAHWWNTMPQYSALFDHHGQVRPAWFAFRFLSRFDVPRLLGESSPGASYR